MLNYFIPMTLASLFLPTKWHVGIAQVKPFDICAIIILCWMVTQARLVARSKAGQGLLLLLPFFVVHVLSAFSYTFANGVREALQVSLLLGFALAINATGPQMDYRKAANVLLICLFAIMIYNVGWHLANGFTSGWKRLNDPKAVFTFLPMLLSLMILFARDNQRRLYWSLLGIVGLVVLLSGERKALLTVGILTVVLISRGRLLRAVPYVMVGIIGLAMFGTVVDNPYISRQIGSLFSSGSANTSLSSIAEGNLTATVSDTVRRFVNDQAMNMFSESPLFGVGTNAFIDLLRSRFAGLPDFVLAGVHNEFMRTLVENGLIGAFLYALIWGAAIYRNINMSSMLARRRWISATQARTLPFLIISPTLLYVSVEASGTRLIVAMMLASLAPQLVYSAVMRGRGTASRPARNVVEFPERSLPVFSASPQAEGM